jgi:hypothetical protein
MLFFKISDAQYFTTGQDRAGIKWKQINTFHYQIIYPNTFEKEARRLATILREVYKVGGNSLGHKPEQISILIHNETIKSNGLVAWAPKRMELYTTPPQDGYAQDWLEQLAIHEYRHVVQIDKIQEELPGLLKLILGEQATALVLGAYIPTWLLEGDAVVAETALTQTGRGRQASFLKDIKAQLSDIGPYSYYKAALGSYKHYVPNHYKMGYLMVGKTREKFGKNIWGDILGSVGRNPFNPWNFDNKLKKLTGRNKVQLYDTLFSELKEEYKNVPQEKDYSYVVSPRKSTYKNYRYGFDLGNERMLVMRSALNDITKFLVLDRANRDEKKVFVPGSIISESVSMGDNLICWVEYRPHYRWEHADNSVVVIYNLKNDRTIELNLGNKVFAPTIAPDRKRLAVVTSDERNNHQLKIVNATSGEELRSFQTKDRALFMSPHWEGNHSILAVAQNRKGKRLVRIIPSTGEIKTLIANSRWDIKKPIRSGNWIFYVANYHGADNIYALHNVTNRIFKVSHSRFGVTDPSVGRGNSVLFYSDYTSKGYDIRELAIDPSKWSEVNINELKSPYRLAELLTKQENNQLAFSDTIVPFPTEPYKRLDDALKVHSWAPAYIDAINQTVKPGISLLTQNKLNTISSNFGFEYDIDRNIGKLAGTVQYNGWIPKFEVTGKIGKDGGKYWVDDQLEDINWNQRELEVNMSLPLRFSRHSYSQLIIPSVGWEYKRWENSSTPQLERNVLGDYNLLRYSLYIQNMQKQSYQDMYPNWGQIFKFTYKHTPKGIFDYGNIWAGQAVGYFPSLFRNHGIKVYVGYQEKSSTLSNYSELIQFPRGMSKLMNDRALAYQLNYKFPLAYPDANIGKLLYVKRVKVNMFYDYIDLKGDFASNDRLYVLDKDFTTYGAEITADCHWFGFAAPIDLGFRMAYDKNEEEIKWGVLFNINFSVL